MQKPEDVVTLMNHETINYLVGNSHVEILPKEVFAESALDFLDDLSRELRNNPVAQKYPDVQTFSFWIRRANILQLKKKANIKQVQIGRGLVFHIAPGNVAINFAYSLAFGIIAGNSNIVRVSSKKFPQVECVCTCINNVLKSNPQWESQISIVEYKQDNKEVTDYYSNLCNVRVVWGGNATINALRQSPINPRTIEVNFTDRVSFSIMDPEVITTLSHQELKNLAKNFYNDTYLMDQNACSSPHIVFWKMNTNQTMSVGIKLFWSALFEIVKQSYTLEGIKAVDKFTDLNLYLAKIGLTNCITLYENYLYVISLDKIRDDIDSYRGRFGMFFECPLIHYDELALFINSTVQTCTYFGIPRDQVLKMILIKGLEGIDRVVPVGKSLDMNIFWDGYDIVNSLSRTIIEF